MDDTSQGASQAPRSQIRRSDAPEQVADQAERAVDGGEASNAGISRPERRAGESGNVEAHQGPGRAPGASSASGSKHVPFHKYEESLVNACNKL